MQEQTPTFEEMEETWGPAASFSEHQRGDHITYTQEDQVYTGTIIWVCAHGDIAGRHVPLMYVVERDDRGGFPDMVLPGDIVEVIRFASL